MSLPNELHPLQLAASSGGYEIEQSLRFNSADSAYLSRTHTAGNQKLWTWSGWVKRGKIGTSGFLFYTRWSGGNSQGGVFFAGDTLRYFARVSGSDKAEVYTTSVFRDPSAWYHVVAVLDAANTSFKFYVNGVEQPLTTVTAVQNADHAINHPEEHNLGNEPTQSGYFDGYLAEVNFIDGSALDPEDFGELDDNGVWRPIAYSGSHGTNGFYLDFSNSSDLGEDQAGSNDWTANNFTTSGTGTDVFSDTPTTNYATLNPLWARNTYGLSTLSNGNLEFGDAGLITSWGGRGSTFEISSGKWYMEWKPTDGSVMSAVLAVLNTGHYGLEHFMVQNPQNQTGCWGPQENGTLRQIIINGTADSSSAPYYDSLDGQIVGIAIDADAGTATWYRNGTAITSLTDVDISTSSKDAWVVMGITSNGSGTSFVANFGQREFEQTPPTGYSAWNTANLPAPDIADGSEYFNTVLWTGNATDNRAITGVGFQPSWTWIKTRSVSDNHNLHDEVRGANRQLFTNSTDLEFTSTTLLKSFDSDGFTLGTDSSVNGSGRTLVAWNWLASNTSGSSNTDGSITSTVSANPTAGFSIVTYTGNGTAGATVGHGLGVAPAFFVVKSRSHEHEWIVYHKSIGATKYLVLQGRNNALTYTPHWNDTEPTSTVFTVGTAGDVNGSSKTFVAYCFAEVEGYSKFGSYTGNGSASDGPFVYCGFRPAMVIIKNITTSLTNWIIRDSARSTYNFVHPSLYPNQADAEINNFPMDFLSNGFKIRDDNGVFNTSGDEYVFMCFAENPFGGDGVSPATSR